MHVRLSDVHPLNLSPQAVGFLFWVPLPLTTMPSDEVSGFDTTAVRPGFNVLGITGEG